MTALQRRAIYMFLGIAVAGLQMAAAQNLFKGVPIVAAVVAVAAVFIGAFMHAWTSPDAPVAPALIEAAGVAAGAIAPTVAKDVVVAQADAEMKKEFPQGGTP